MNKTHLCQTCNEDFELRQEEDPYIIDGNIVCDECYKYNHTEICGLCEDDFPKDEANFFILDKESASFHKMKPGVYKILSKPFFIGTIFGFERFIEDRIVIFKEASLSNQQSEFICESCLNEL